MSYLLDIAYFFALLATSPIWLVKMIGHGRYRTRWNQRFGLLPRRYGRQPIIWIHAVSLGEVNATVTLVEEIHSQLPEYQVIISTTTDTGFNAAYKRYAPAHQVVQWPMDFTWAVRIALKRVRPDLVIMMEGEAWPNFLAECNRRNIPTMIVNGRMSPNKGYPRYKKLGAFATRLFNRLTAIGVQDESYAERFLALGVEPEKVKLTGMMKFDTVHIANHIPGQNALVEALGLKNDPLLVAGGTGPGEEAMLLEAWQSLRENVPNLRLAIVPRKPERFEDVAKLIEQKNIPCVRRSQRPDGTPGILPEGAVVLGDTMGELRAFYSLATVIFVGRSLTPMGGSDMIEAAALGKPTSFGPHTFNFPQAETLAERGCRRVADLPGLIAQLRIWLTDPDSAKADAENAQQYIRSQQGATRRNVELICRILGRRPALIQGDIATESLHSMESSA